MSDPRPVLILGMHRSGTSCLAGLLEECGLHLGEVRRRSAHNARGNRENPQVMQLNEALLAANGARWDAPPEGRIRWNADLARRRDALLGGYPQGRRFGIKDPRLLFCLPFWAEALGPVRLVATVRHPRAVARSLAVRSGMPAARAIALWRAYNAQLLKLARDRARDLTLVTFDAGEAAYLAAVTRLSGALGLAPPAEGLRFFDAGLRHHSGVGTPDEPETGARPDARDGGTPLCRETRALHAALLERVAPP